MHPIPALLVAGGVFAMSCMACHAAPREMPIAMSEGVPSDAHQIDDYPAAIDAIVRVLAGKFALPVPRLTLAIYATRDEFEAGLKTHLGLKPELARSTASFSQAAVGGGRVLVNEVQVAGLSWPERIELLAHELTHTVQLKLAGHRSLVRQQWLTEGFAERLAYEVTESLGLDDMARVRARLVPRVRASPALPRLAELDSFAQWVAARQKYGYDATFSLSFLAVEFLIARHTFGTVVGYFRLFRVSGSYTGNFRTAFGESIEEFEAELERHLAQLLLGGLEWNHAFGNAGGLGNRASVARRFS